MLAVVVARYSSGALHKLFTSGFVDDVCHYCCECVKTVVAGGVCKRHRGGTVW